MKCQHDGTKGGGNLKISRRNVLAAGGVVALGGLAGCLDRVAGAATTTAASPAGAMSGTVIAGGVDELQAAYTNRRNRALDVEHAGVRDLSVTVRAGNERLSREFDLGGWTTDTAVKAQDYNTVRSNKRRSAFGGSPDPDDEHDDTADDDALDSDTRALYAYLDGEATIGERFTVCLPDARLPGGGPALAEEVTPQRFLDYLLGAAKTCATDDGGSLYCWGRSARLDAELTERPDDWGVSGHAVRGGVVVTNTPPTAESSSRVLYVTDDDEPYEPDSLDDWGAATRAGEVTVTPTVVCPIAARPSDAPTAMPAVVYFRRCHHGDEYLYTGGWVIDDAALYDDSCTLLVTEGPNEVVAFTPADAGDGAERRRRSVGRRLRRARSSKGAAAYDGEMDEDMLAHLPESFHERAALDGLVSLVELSSVAARTGRNPQTGKEIKIPARDGPPGSDETAMRCLVVALDCPLAHLVDADDLSTDEKAAAYDAFLKIEGVEGERN